VKWAREWATTQRPLSWLRGSALSELVLVLFFDSGPRIKKKKTGNSSGVHKFLRHFNVTVFRLSSFLPSAFYILVGRQDLFRVCPRPRRSLNCLEIADSRIRSLRKYLSIQTQITTEPSPRPHSQMNHKMTENRRHTHTYSGLTI